MATHIITTHPGPEPSGAPVCDTCGEPVDYTEPHKALLIYDPADTLAESYRTILLHPHCELKAEHDGGEGPEAELRLFEPNGVGRAEYAKFLQTAMLRLLVSLDNEELEEVGLTNALQVLKTVRASLGYQQ